MDLCPVHLMITLFLYLLLQTAQAGNRYCKISRTDQFQIDNEPKFVEDRIIPKTSGEPVPKEGIDCAWKISADRLNADSIVLLRGFFHTDPNRRVVANLTDQSQLMRYEVHAKTATSICSTNLPRESKPVELGLLRVLQLPKRSYLHVSFRLRPSNEPDTPGLIVQLIERGFCSRSIPNFDRTCYTAGTIRRSLTEELTVLEEDGRIMRLASFNSFTALQNFVKESQRTRIGTRLSTRSKEPLGLTQWLRIGMFYEHMTKLIFYLRSAGNKCEMAKFENPHRLNFTIQASNSLVSCGSLRTAQHPGGGEAIVLVDFADCSQPLPALISFADAARNRCENCSNIVLTWLRGSHIPQLQSKEQLSPATIVLIIFAPLAFLTLAVNIALLCCNLAVQRQRHNRRRM